MGTRLSIPEHTRRMFLGAAAGLVAAGAAGGLARVATADNERRSGLSESERALGDLDLPEFVLTDYSRRVTSYTTAWGATVEDWYPAFLAVKADIETGGGGRLIVPAGEYRISGHVVFDTPAMSVHLRQDSYIELVGDPDVFLGAPIGFFGNAKPGEPIENRIQRDFAAVLGPGSVGYPADQLDRYPHENGVAMSYMKTAIMDGVNVPHVPGKGLTAQFGCNEIIIRNCTIDTTSTAQVELDYRGQASIVAQGGLSFDRRTAADPLFTTVVIDNNTVGGSIVRGIHASYCKSVKITRNTLAPSFGAGLLVKGVTDATIERNVWPSTSAGVPKPGSTASSGYDLGAGEHEDALILANVEHSRLLRNELGGSDHRHCVYSWTDPRYPHYPAGVAYARENTWSRGSDTIFGGSPQWNSDDNY